MYLFFKEDDEIRLIQVMDNVDEQIVKLAKEIKGDIHIVSAAKILECIRDILHKASALDDAEKKAKHIEVALQLIDGLNTKTITEGRETL